MPFRSHPLPPGSMLPWGLKTKQNKNLVGWTLLACGSRAELQWLCPQIEARWAKCWFHSRMSGVSCLHFPSMLKYLGCYVERQPRPGQFLPLVTFSDHAFETCWNRLSDTKLGSWGLKKTISIFSCQETLEKPQMKPQVKCLWPWSTEEVPKQGGSGGVRWWGSCVQTHDRTMDRDQQASLTRSHSQMQLSLMQLCMRWCCTSVDNVWNAWCGTWAFLDWAVLECPTQ